MESVRGINVPMYTTLRRTTVAFTMIVEHILTRQKHSYPVMGRYTIHLLFHNCGISFIGRNKMMGYMKFSHAHERIVLQLSLYVFDTFLNGMHPRTSSVWG